jgi:catechol 2,3-dioxygenase-like lactoylglutathione lyase family enzyme
MFSHIMVGVSDFKRAMAFYTPVLQALGVQFRFLEEDRPWAGWQSSPDPRPLFLIGRPHNQAPHQPGNSVQLIRHAQLQLHKLCVISVKKPRYWICRIVFA